MTNDSIAIYPGTFDPPSFGHINIIERALKIFDHVIVALPQGSTKSCLFTVTERQQLLQDLFPSHPHVSVMTFDGLLVDFAKKNQAKAIIRGIRTVADYEYEFQMSLANKKLCPQIETVFMMTEGHFSHISSSIIKQIMQLGGSGQEFLPASIEEKMRHKIAQMQSDNIKK